MAYEGMIAETLSIRGDKNEPISAYVARPLGPGPFPGMVLLPEAVPGVVPSPLFGTVPVPGIAPG